MYQTINLLFIIIFFNLYQDSNQFDTIIFPESTGAKCQDGQPSGYIAFKPNLKQNITKYIIDFLPVGWCNHEQTEDNFLGSCYDRSLNHFGSYHLQLQYTQRFHLGGIHDQNQQNNPYFLDWIYIMISSCDGTLNQGYSKDPYIYKNREIWFRGENTTKAALNDAWDRYNLKNATEVLIMGGSSAGLTALLWSNYIRNMFPDTTKMWTYIDAGFYIDYIYLPTGKYRLRQQMMNIITYANVEVDPINKECVEDNPDEKWKCLLAEYAVQYVKNPIFLSQFDYDAWMMYNQLGIACENFKLGKGNCIHCFNKVNDLVEEWKNYVVEKIESALNYKKGNYYWRLPCFYHCMHFDNLIFNKQQEFSYNSSTISEALYKWMYNL